MWTIFIIIFVYLLVSLSAVHSSRNVSYDYSEDSQSVSRYERALRVAADGCYPPYTFFDGEQLPTGHDVELIYALAREMQCGIDLTLTDRESAYVGLKDGSFDLLLGADYSASEILDGFSCSAPILSDGFVFFGRDGDGSKDIDCFSAKDLRIAALKNSGEEETFLIPMGIDRLCTLYDSVSEAFQSVVNGENDLVICNDTVGKAVIGLYDLPIVEKSKRLHETSCHILYRQEDEELGAELNAAIEKLRSSGALSSLRKKWVDRYAPGLTLQHFFRNNLQAIITMMLITFLIVLVLFVFITRNMHQREKTLLETDQLTGLYNLSPFLVHIQELLETYPKEKFVILFYNINQFRIFNDVYGTNTADRMLQSLGRKLKSEAGEKIFFAHSNADTFFECRPLQDFNVKDSYEKFTAFLTESFPGYNFSARIGYCPIEHGDDPAQICDRAQLAQRSLKNEYNKHWAAYSPEMFTAILEDNQVTGEVSGALEHGNFIPYFQPQYDYTTGQIVGAEVLMRWQHPEKGLLLPLKFIPVLEKNGFIYELDKYAWRQACKCMRQWKDEGISPPPLSVNVSRRDIYQDDLIDTLVSLIEEYGLEPDDLRLEITESGYIENAQLLSNTIQKLSELGFYIEMDDFGSGYSSLSILKDLPFNLVKLDMSLVRESSQPGRAGSILTSIVHLAHQINVPVIAEGVETYSQAEFLKSIGCHYMQGYLFSKPVPFPVYNSLIKNGSSRIAGETEDPLPGGSDEYFTQDSQETLLFNNYVGGAYIAEFCNNCVNILRTNDRFFSVLNISREQWEGMSTDFTSYLSAEDRKTYTDMLTAAIVTAQEAECELDGGKETRVRTKAKCIANRFGCCIFFCEVECV